MEIVRLELARCREFPEGSKTHGYTLKLPLDSAGRLTPSNWSRQRHSASFTRFWGADIERGRLAHGRHGWGLAFDDDNEIEPIFRSADHLFVTGEYVSITERDGMTRTFRVASVTPDGPIRGRVEVAGRLADASP